MASAAGESGDGGGDRCPSREKGTTRVGCRSKKTSTFHRAALRYLEKEYRECMARDAEPPSSPKFTFYFMKLYSH